MADGDAVIQDIVACNYADDFGNLHVRKVKSFYQTQAQLGWTLLSNHSLQSAPRGLKPRAWLVALTSDPTRRSRVTVATNAAYFAGVMDTATVKVIYRGVEETQTLYGKEGERLRGQIRDVVVQETPGP